MMRHSKRQIRQPGVAQDLLTSLRNGDSKSAQRISFHLRHKIYSYLAIFNLSSYWLILLNCRTISFILFAHLPPSALRAIFTHDHSTASITLIIQTTFSDFCIDPARPRGHCLLYFSIVTLSDQTSTSC